MVGSLPPSLGMSLLPLCVCPSYPPGYVPPVSHAGYAPPVSHAGYVRLLPCWVCTPPAMLGMCTVRAVCAPFEQYVHRYRLSHRGLGWARDLRYSLGCLTFNTQMCHIPAHLVTFSQINVDQAALGRGAGGGVPEGVES